MMWLEVNRCNAFQAYLCGSEQEATINLKNQLERVETVRADSLVEACHEFVEWGGRDFGMLNCGF
ncbi:MAG: hypothetical protein Q7U66_10205 [Methylobacter sp.]|nr:hypothetical protein [Methylobacter sp.]